MAGPEFLYAYNNGQILPLSIDRDSGALTALSPVPGPAISLGMTAVNNQFLYVSDFQTAQLYGYGINQTTGALTALANSPFSTGTLSAPSGLASPTNNSLLYAGDAGVDTFAISASGVPTLIPPPPLSSGADLFVTVDPSGLFLYASDDDAPGGISAFTIGSSGALTPVQGSPFTNPGQTVANSRPAGIVDTGAFIYTALTDANQVAAFSFANGTGALTPVPGSPFPAGVSPSAVVFANGLLYVLNGGSISGYSVNLTTGALTPLAASPFAIVGGSMATDYLGGYLYVSGISGIQAFAINTANGALTPLSGSPFGASGARLMTMVQIPPP
jgi:6-phosphogluconolactonase (cycloisomerase 2 family)